MYPGWDIKDTEGEGSGEEHEPAYEPKTEAGSGVLAGTEVQQGLTDEEKQELVRIHCSQKAIDTVDTDSLAWLVDLVKNRLEPQAVNLLVEIFPSFTEASENDKLGREMGLYVYYGSDTLDDMPMSSGDLANILWIS